MARETGVAVWNRDLKKWQVDQNLKDFEALVRADAIAEEREACAKVCGMKHNTWRWDNEAEIASGPRECAAAIRERSTNAGARHD
jgi:hypothetical protein